MTPPRSRSDRVRAALAALALLAGCAPKAGPARLFVHVPRSPAKGLDLAAADLVHDLHRISGRTVNREGLPAPKCKEGEVHLLVLGSAHDQTGAKATPPLASEAYTIRETRCGTNGRRIVLRGGSLLSGQWAVYDLLHRLGVRYLHPEETLYPTRLVWPNAPIDVDASPSFVLRSMHAHRTHPIELSPPLDATGLDMAGYQKRWIDWNVKLRQTSVDGFDTSLVGTYAFDRGFPRSAGMTLLNTQQGGRPVIDPDNPAPEDQQIADAIDARMAHVDGEPDPTRFGFTFDPSEFTTADDQKTVARLDFIASYFAKSYPGVDLYTIDHGTHEDPTPHYGVRFFALPGLAPGNLGVEVHMLMFYGLDRPAPVYGNTDFGFQRDFIEAQAPKRRIVYYPESSWWLTFDEPVPLYLAPVTLEARGRDVEILKPMLSGGEGDPHGVYGHELFTSGEEWGYWLIDWCVARMDFDDSVSWQQCVDDFTGSLADGATISKVLEAVAARQVNEMRNPDIIRFVVGSDDETEVADQVGVHFHPLPPQPKAVLQYTDAQVATLTTYSLGPLEKSADAYDAWADEIAATLPDQSKAQAPFVREIRDGLRIFALRERHAVKVYRTVLALRAAIASGDLTAVHQAATGVDDARALTDQARKVVRAREKDYRYPPALTVAGDEPGTPDALPNRTIYPYRYLSRTHRMFYWTRPDDELAALFGEGLSSVSVDRRIAVTGSPVTVSVLADGVSGLRVDWGDGTVATDLSPHAFGADGFYTWSLDATTATGVLHHDDDLAAVGKRYVFPKGSLSIDDPSGAAAIQSLVPGFVVGLGDDGTPFMVLGRLDDAAETSAAGSLVRRDRTGSSSGPADLDLTLKKIGALTVRDATISVADGSGPNDRKLTISGSMVTSDVIDLVVSVGGFDKVGATKLVASILGYTPDTLPASIAFTLSATGHDG